jgi:hypothetical protein
LVLCGNAYLGRVSATLSRRILGVGTYMIATEPLASARALLPSNAAIADINWILDYFRRSADDRLLFGGRVSYSALQPRHLAESMRKRLARVFPDLAAARIDYAWGGFLDITMTRAPDFGRLASNVFYLQGFWRAPPSVSTCSPAFPIATSRAARCCADPRWCWRCCTTGCAISCNRNSVILTGSHVQGESPPCGNKKAAVPARRTLAPGRGRATQHHAHSILYAFGPVS